MVAWPGMRAQGVLLPSTGPARAEVFESGWGTPGLDRACIRRTKGEGPGRGEAVAEAKEEGLFL